MKDGRYHPTEKRRHPRTAFAPGWRPTFQALPHEFEIEDISRSGLKFCFTGKPIRFEGWVRGSIGWPGRDRIEVEGIVVRTAERGLGLSFVGELSEELYRQILETEAPATPS